MDRQVVAYHMAEGEVVSRNDPEGRPSVYDRLPLLRGQRWVSIGRLDIDSAGLLLFTNDSEFANRLMHPSTGIEREYAVRLTAPLVADRQRALLDGVMLEDGLSRFSAIADAGSQGGGHWYRCSLAGNKFREVRRLWESQGCVIERLVRIRFGSYALPSSLRQGNCMALTDEDILRLEQLCALPAKKHTGLYGRARRLADRQERGPDQAGAPRDDARDDESRNDVDGNRMERPRPRGGYLRSRR
ncbi:MAG: pseudouridine synthase [Gammaproteobacteria bacterium]